MSIQSNKAGQTYIRVGIVFWVEFAIVIGLAALFIAWNFANINWDAGPTAITPQLIAASITGGFVGGLLTRSFKKGMLPGIILAIVVLVPLVIVAIIDAAANIDIVPRVYSSGNIVNKTLTVVTWFMPVYIILACTIPAGMIGGYIAFKFIKVPPRRKQLSVREQFSRFLNAFKKPLFVIIFVIVWIPLIIPLFSGNNNVQKEYSAWNDGESGTSVFREKVQAAGYSDVMSSITSYSILSRINESFVLVVLAPNRFFNPVSDIPFLEKFLKNNGSLLIADEEGSTDWLFTDLCAATIGQMINGHSSTFPLLFFMNGILRDNASYYMQNDFPVINAANINHATIGGVNDPIMHNVNALVLNHASALMLLPGMASIFGWNLLATSTSQYSWVDKAQPGFSNGDNKYEPTIDTFNPSTLSLPGLLFDYLKSKGISFPDGIPQGGYPLPVVAASELGSNSSRIIVTSDASMFSNQLTGLSGYDNLQFALNCIDWLTNGNHSMKIVFDEYHLRPDSGQDTSASALYGQVLDYVSFMSSNWIIAPFYPFAALATLRRWLPKSEEQLRKKQEKRQKKEAQKVRSANKKARRERRVLGRLLFEKQAQEKPKETGALKTKSKTLQQKRTEKRIERMGIMKKSTFFAQKLAWFEERSEFNHALELLYNRIKRLAAKKIGENASEDAITSAIVDKYPQVERKKIDQFFKKMKKITRKGAGKQKITRLESFENLYYEIVTIGEYLEKM